MKGVELPINILVIVAIAVIVLLGLVALYFVGFGPFSSVAGQDAIRNQGCTEFNRQENCVVDPSTIAVNFDVKSDGVTTNDNLMDFCEEYYGCNDEDALCVRRLCACPGY